MLVAAGKRGGGGGDLFLRCKCVVCKSDIEYRSGMIFASNVTVCVKL